MTPSQQYPFLTVAIRAQLVAASCLDPAPDFKNDDPKAIEEDLGLDSLDMVEIQMAVEDAFEISIHNVEWINCRTVDDIVALVAKKKDIIGGQVA